jgi:hypothetical protein
MKSRNIVFARIACTLLCLCAFASAGFAAPKPISYPRGLAVDAKGNLYVANSGGNDILVYNPSYSQMMAKNDHSERHQSDRCGLRPERQSLGR